MKKRELEKTCENMVKNDSVKRQNFPDKIYQSFKVDTSADGT